MLCRIFFSSLLLLASTAAIHATPSSDLQLLHQKILSQHLWENSEWLNLLHFGDNSNEHHSHIIDRKFFIADNGANDPKAELLQTLNAIFQPVEQYKNQNRHPQCRYPARFNWLVDKLKLSRQALPQPSCEAYRKWRQENPLGKVTMIFPAYHLNSPSSMFGHTLLRLDPAGNNTDWLSLAVNFGANVNDEDNSIVYAFRGLAGGYPGTFVTRPYYKKIQEYGRIEHRDIWEYPLNLTTEEINRLVSHLWELQEVNFSYYFFDENCSYRLLELLEVARPDTELTDEFIVTAIPVDTVRAIAKAGMIDAVDYRPAQVTRLQFMLDQIPQSQQQLVLDLSKDIAVLQTEAFTHLSEKQQKSTVELAYHFLRYQNTGETRDELVARRSFQLLKKLNSYPAKISNHLDIPVPVAPEQSHRSKRISIAAGERLDNRYAELGFKFAFHDLEDNQYGFLQGAQINIGSLKLRAEENKGLRIYQLDIVDIFSLTPRNDFFKPLSWRIYSGFERQFTGNVDQLSYHVTGGMGGSWQAVKSHQLYALAILRLEINKQLKNTIEPAIGFNAGLLSHFKHTTARLEFSGEQFEDSIYRLRAQYTQNFPLSTNQSIKIFYKYQWQENNTEFSDLNLSYQYYY